MTGLSGAGKSTLANALEQELNKQGKHTYILDGDNLRHGLNSDLGFTEADRNENVRRAAEAAQLMVDAGLIVIVGLISPFKKERDWARSLFKPNQFKEIYISTSLKNASIEIQRVSMKKHDEVRSKTLPASTHLMRHLKIQKSSSIPKINGGGMCAHHFTKGWLGVSRWSLRILDQVKDIAKSRASDS